MNISITVGKDTKKSMKLLGIDNYPFYNNELVTAFRRELKKTHPDMFIDEKEKAAAHEKMICLTDAFEELKNLAFPDDDPFSKRLHIKKDNQDMFDITEICPRCYGGGTVDEIKHVHNQIKNKEKHCEECGGKGYVITKKNKKVICRKCDRRRDKYRYTYSDSWNKYTTTTKKCPTCDGVGRIKKELLNPVIKKGAILF